LKIRYSITPVLPVELVVLLMPVSSQKLNDPLEMGRLVFGWGTRITRAFHGTRRFAASVAYALLSKIVPDNFVEPAVLILTR